MPSLNLIDPDGPEALSLWAEFVRPTLAPYAHAHQSGVREGTTLREHLDNGVSFIGTVLPELGWTDAECALLIAAFTVHDANKMLGEDRSLARVARSEGFEALLRQHRLDDYLDALVEGEWLEDLRFLVINTASKHGRPADALLMDAERSERLLHRLRPAMTAADIHDLSPDFGGLRQKEKLRLELSRAGGRPLYLLHHRLGEHLGPFTALLHTAAARCARERGAVPTWVYPEGTWYLSPRPELEITTKELCRAYVEERDEAFGGGLAVMVDTNAKDGFKIDPNALSKWGDAELVGLAEDFIRGKPPDSVVKTLDRRRGRRDVEDPTHPAQLPPPHRWPEGEDEVIAGRMWLAAENLLKHKRVPFRGDPAERLVPAVAEVTGDALEGVLELGLSKVYERPYLLAASCADPWAGARAAFGAAASLARELGGFVLGEPKLPEDLRRYIADHVRWGGPERTDPLTAEDMGVYLESWLAGPRHRSSLGASRGKVGKLMSREVMAGVKVTQFSNALLPGTGSPKRRRDAVQAEAMTVQARSVRYPSKAPPLFLHLFPARASTKGRWDASAGAIRRTLEAADDQRALIATPKELEGQLTVDWTGRFYGIVPLGSRRLHGNGLSLPVAPPPDAPDTLAFLEATTQATWLAVEAGLRAVLSPLLSVLPPEPEERLRFEGAPLLLAALPERVDQDQLPAFLARMAAWDRLNRELRPLGGRRVGDVRMDLVRASTRTPLHRLFTLDRLVERRCDHPAAALRLAARCLPLLRHLSLEPDMPEKQPISDALSRMAEVAVDAHLLGDDWKRNNLARPFNELLKLLRRSRGDDLDYLLAAAEERIVTAKETLAKRAGYGVGRSHREGARAFTEAFRALLEEGYGGELGRLRTDERLLRSAFITYVRRELDARHPPKTDADEPAA